MSQGRAHDPGDLRLVRLAPDGAGGEQLVWSSDSEPGIRRSGTTRFAYRDADGRVVRDPATLARIRALAIPPAWTDVWICANESGHLQATGRDAKGRKQRRYHALFRSEREDLKYAQLVDFGDALGRIRKRVERDLRASAPTATRQVALVVRLLDLTAMRIGNERYARENGSFGLSTLRPRNVRVQGADITFAFLGKSGRRHVVELHDRRLARLVRQAQDLPGQTLFTWVGPDADVHAVCSHHVNDYLHTASGSTFTAKTFRTWTGTTAAAAFLAVQPAPPRKATLVAGIDRAAAVLGNTRAVCRASYVHPTITGTYLDGSLRDRWSSGPTRSTTVLTRDERRTLHVLRTAS